MLNVFGSEDPLKIYLGFFVASGRGNGVDVSCLVVCTRLWICFTMTNHESYQDGVVDEPCHAENLDTNCEPFFSSFAPLS